MGLETLHVSAELLTLAPEVVARGSFSEPPAASGQLTAELEPPAAVTIGLEEREAPS